MAVKYSKLTLRKSKNKQLHLNGVHVKRFILLLFIISILVGCATNKSEGLDKATTAPLNNIDNLHSYIASGGDLFLGELHGTNEVPELFRNLIETAIFAKRSNKEKLIVSLEKSNDARDLESWFWEGRDGRSSVAMWELVKYLLTEELAGNLELHFQHSMNDQFWNMSANEREESIGKEIARLSIDAQVLILGGNIHSSKDLSVLGEFGENLKSVGMFLNPDMLHIYVEVIGESELWVCFGDPDSECGIQNKTSVFEDAKAGSLIDGVMLSHDYILFIPPTTASLPKYENRDKEKLQTN